MKAIDIQGLSIVVTGGAAGIGLATAQMLAEEGAIVTTLDIQQHSDRRWTHKVVDLRDAHSVQEAIHAAAEANGGLDVLVNNAGVSFNGGIEDGTEEEWNNLWNVNVMGYVRATRASLQFLRKSATPAIINVSSCTAASGIPKRSLYSATKGAIRSMTMSMASDLVHEGIRVVAVNPGTVDTPFMDQLAAASDDPVAKRREFHERQPMGRMVKPEEVAAAITYLASPLAAPTTGTILTIDGGMEALRTAPSTLNQEGNLR